MRTILCLALLFASPAWARPKRHKRPVERPAPVAPAPAPSEPPAAVEPAPSTPPTTEAAPAPPPAPAPAAPAAAETPRPDATSVDLQALADEYHQLRDELFRSRAKAEMVGKALFKTRMVATFLYKAARVWPLKKVTLSLDDQPVASQDAPNASDDPVKLFEGFVAPGRHKLTVRVECGAAGDPNQAYTAESSFVVEAVDGKQAHVKLTVDETGDGPRALAKNKGGTFDVRVRGDVSMEKLER